MTLSSPALSFNSGTDDALGQPSMRDHTMTCSEIWGGIGTIDQDVATKGVQASIFSKAAGSICGGDIHYLSYCTYDMLTRLVVADVSGHCETVTLLSSWVYDSLKAEINSLAGDQILFKLNRKICARGFEAITTAAVLTYDSSSSFTDEP